MSIAASLPTSSRLVQYYQLTKPRVVQLIVFCAFIGMVLAVPGVPGWQDWKMMLAACAGIWLVNDGQAVPDKITPALHQGTALWVPAAAISNWLKPEAGHSLDEHLYVVDPQGHWMMRFPADMDKAAAGKAKRDLERLLRASSSWDEAGRGDAKSGDK